MLYKSCKNVQDGIVVGLCAALIFYFLPARWLLLYVLVRFRLLGYNIILARRCISQWNFISLPLLIALFSKHLLVNFRFYL